MAETEKKEKQKKVTTPPRVPRRANNVKKKNWWKELPEEKCDPITLEPFCEQTHAPFELLGKKFKREQSYSSLLTDDEEENETRFSRATRGRPAPGGRPCSAARAAPGRASPPTGPRTGAARRPAGRPTSRGRLQVAPRETAHLRLHQHARNFHTCR